MEENKKWYESKTIIASIVVVAATVGGFFGYTIDQDTQDRAVDLALAGVAVIGNIVAIWGRVKASKAIK